MKTLSSACLLAFFGLVATMHSQTPKEIKVSSAEMYVHLLELDQYKKPWKEPAILKGNERRVFEKMDSTGQIVNQETGKPK
jgi:hypothetical protein